MTRKTGPRWTFVDRIVELFSAEKAAQRFQSRTVLDLKRRAYDAASRGRGTAGWFTGPTSADVEIAGAGSLIRDRMRDLVRNNALAAQAVQVLVGSIVGTGIRPRARTGDPKADERIDAAFEAWSMTCDAHGHTDFYGLQALAVREMIEGGDCFALRRQLTRSEGGPVPLRIELREADHLDPARFANLEGGRRIVGGIEYDRRGGRAAYWMFPEHPGDRFPLHPGRSEAERVPAGQVVHLFERQRVQARGVPWGAPAMRAMRDLGDWQEAELVRKKTEAALVAVVIGDEGADFTGINPQGTTTGEPSEGRGDAMRFVDQEGKQIEGFEPGLIAYLTGGREVKFNQPAPAGGVAEWNRVQMHLIAAGFRVPYALMTGDLSQANFSSSRAGLNEFRRMVESVQWQTVIPMFCAPVWRWFIETAQVAGIVPEGTTISVEWGPPKFESVNPLQDVQADILEVRAGFSTLLQQIARRGYDPRAAIEEWKEAAALVDAAGLIFDTDPRRVARTGILQPDPAAQGDDDSSAGAGGDDKPGADERARKSH